MEIMKIVKLSFLLAFGGLLFAQDQITILHPGGDEFLKLVKSLESNLEGEVSVKVVSTKGKKSWEDLAGDVNVAETKVFVLLDNSSVKLYKEYFESSEENKIPSIATMALQLNKISEGLPMLGISYEIPVVTSVVNLRPITKEPIEKVGVIYRKSWENFYQENKEFCQTENVDLVGYAVDTDDPKKAMKKIKKGIKELMDQEVDALWVLSDNTLVNGKSISKYWIPGLKKAKVPVIVGVESLIATKLKLGNFAVLPDNVALGGQVAELVFELMDSEWEIEESRIDQPLSVIKTVNTTLAKKNEFLNEEGLSSIDKEIE